jgi:hypothetical protein
MTTGLRLVGAPKGSRNALKTGLYTAELRALRKRVWLCTRRLRAAAALAMAECRHG